MILRIVDFALHQRFITLAFTLLLTLGGITAFYRLPIEAYPDVADVEVDVITLWPGHAPEEVERHITMPLERELNGIARVTFLRSISNFGLSNIRVLFLDGTDNYWARQQVQERIAQAEVPADVKPGLGPLASFVIAEIYRYTLESKTIPLVELKALQDWFLEREFRKVAGVVDVISWGGGIKQYQIMINPERLRAYNLTLKQVFDAVSGSNANAGGSYIPRGEYALTVRGLGLMQSTRDIEDTVIASQKGTPVRVRDIGQVGIGHRVRLGVLGRDHEDDLVQGIVLMRKGENPGIVIEAVRKKIAEIQKLLPAGVELRPYYNRDQLVKTTVTTVMRNLIEGAVLVIIVLSLFLYNVRAAFIVALTIPLSLLFAFIFMDLRGIPANLLSLGAIDFGIIVDGAVVVTENIVRHLSHKPQGYLVQREVRHAAAEVARPLTFAVLIIMTVYVPILTFQRIEGRLFAPMAVTISVAVIGSLLLTLTLIPVLASFLFRRPPSERESPILIFLRRLYTPALRWCLHRPSLPILGAAGLFLLALVVFTRLGKEFLPELDEGDVWLRVKFPVGISLEAAQPYVREIRERLLKFPEVRVVVSQTGSPDDGTDPNGPDNSEFYVGLKPRSEWKIKDKDKLIEAMNAALTNIPGIRMNFSQPIKDNVDEALAGIKGELAIKLFGPDLFVLEAKAKEITEVLRPIRGVADLDYDHLVGQPQLQIKVDRAAAARYGILVQDIQDAIETATKGRVTTQIFEGERRFDLATRLSQDGDLLARLRNLQVSAPDGSRIPITQLSEISESEGLAMILREGNVRRVGIKWSVRGRDMGGLVNEAMQKVNATVKLPEGYQMVWSGRFEDQQRALARLYIIVPLVLFIIFILLFSTFQSLGDALLIMLNLPFAIIGGTIALYLWGTHFSISAAVGYIAVFGVSVLDGVVLVSFIRQSIAENVDLREAIVRGCETRFRPIIVTAIVAIIGFLPAAMSHGIGAEIQRPLARVVIGGLISATAMTLLVLPAIYELLARRLERRQVTRAQTP